MGEIEQTPPPRRGRPRKPPEAQAARQTLIRVGLAYLTERGYSTVGIDEILAASQVPKGSFYYHFGTKAAFGRTLIDAYDTYFREKLSRWFKDTTLTPLERLAGFIGEADAGMAKHTYKRGCLIGNLGQEMASLPEEFREELVKVLDGWQAVTVELLRQAQDAGEIASHHNPVELAAFFWIGWEGAVLRAKLDRSGAPLQQFASGYFTLISS